MAPADFPKVKRRVVALTVVGCMALLLVLQTFGLQNRMSIYTSLPIAFRLRSWIGQSPPLHPQLKIFAMDDSTYASLRRRDLSGGDWAELLTTLAQAKPAAVITTHMFGASEFTDNDGALPKAIDRVTGQGVKVVAAAFPYPGKIRYRLPLTLPPARDELTPRQQDGRMTVPTSLPDWHLYGPGPEEAAQFSAIGHVAYDGLGWFSPYLELAADPVVAPHGSTQIVPHLGLAVGGYIRTTRNGAAVGHGQPQVDSDGRTLIDALPLSDYMARSKSLRVLFGPGAAQAAAKHVQFGDTVLILTDQFTGRTSFVDTPLGGVPGGYLVAAVLSSVLSGRWLEPLRYSTWLLLLAAVLGSWLGGRASWRTVRWAWPGGTVFLHLAGALLFIYAQIVTPWLAIAGAFTFCAGALVVWRLRRQLLLVRRRARVQADETVKLQTVVRTTQMLAHDVRKPFSVLKAAAKALQSQSDPNVQINLVKKLGPELERAIATVDSLVDEVLAIERASPEATGPSSVEELVLASLRTVFTAAPDARIRLSYRFDHTADAAGDASKWLRVCQNIFENAVDALTIMQAPMLAASPEAMGRIWVTTRNAAGGMIEMCVGNNGVAVPPEHGERLFEAFYRSGKPDGAGLGLAIAQKVVTEHGGRIWYQSSPERGTEFFLTMPSAPGTKATPASQPLPATSMMVHSVAKPRPTRAAPEPILSSKSKSEAWLAVLDDNPFIIEAWQAAVTDARVFTFLSPEAFWAYAASDERFLAELDCVVTDYNFDRASASNGIQFAEELRARVPVRICLSSDAVFSAQISAAIDEVIPKEPVAFAVLMNKRQGSSPNL